MLGKHCPLELHPESVLYFILRLFLTNLARLALNLTQRDLERSILLPQGLGHQSGGNSTFQYSVLQTAHVKGNPNKNSKPLH